MNRFKFKVTGCLVATFSVFLFSGCVSTDLVQEMLKDIENLKTENARMKEDLKEIETRVNDMNEAEPSMANESAVEPDESVTVYEDMESLLAGTESGESIPVPEERRPSAVTGEELYSRAQALYSQQRYREAVQVYNQARLLDDSSEFQARCHYWIGECMFAQGAFERALESFAQVFVKYGSSSKASDALLKIGFTYYEMRNYNGARQALNEFIQRFPDHRAVPFAEERLRWMDNLESGDAPSER